MTRLPRRTLALATGLLTAMATLAGCTRDRAGFVDPDVPAGSFGLVAFDSCAQALDGLRAAARSAVGPYGFNGGGIQDSASGAERGAPAQPALPVPAPAAGADGAAAKANEGAGSSVFSGTNTHEVGADEPDLVKTDGRRIITVSNGRLRIVDAASRRLSGAVDLADPAFPDDRYRYAAGDLLLAGDHALVLMNQYYTYSGRGPIFDIAPAPGSVPGGTPDPDAIMGPSILLVDLNGQKVLSRARVDGALVDARQVGATARVVVRSSPRIDFPMPADGDVQARVAANRAIIDATGIEAWAPRLEVTSGRSTARSQVGCEAISRPSSYSGTNLLTVLTFDIAAGVLTDGQPVSIVADGDTVYSNGPTLYVASNQAWRAVPMDDGTGAIAPVEPSTEIYKFDTSSPARPTFVAGGSVPGYLINQYAMSDWDGKLRVATTTNADPAQQGASHSGVYILAQDGGVLRSIGAVDGLGKGERIYSVRFVATVGYVVTFRQTDPLYTLDLSDPTRPTVVGELKIPGYSAYLHPAGGTKLIGVGQNATDQGRVTGTQVSLFDVADLTNPARLAQYTLDGAQSEAEFEPHAFLYWPAEGLLVLPLQGKGPMASNGTRQAPSTGALVLRISGTDIRQVGFLSHPGTPQNGGYAPPIRRSLIIDTTLWTVSETGLMASDSRSLARLAWIPFV
jgi:hypothetical protein